MANKKKKRTKTRHFIDFKFLSVFVHANKKKKKKGNRTQISQREINDN
jgi:hypothetical protein